MTRPDLSQLEGVARTVTAHSADMGYGYLTDDAYQEAILATLEAARSPTYNPLRGSLGGWGYRSAVRKVADYCRRISAPVTTPTRPRQALARMLRKKTRRVSLERIVERGAMPPVREASPIMWRVWQVLSAACPSEAGWLYQVLGEEMTVEEIARQRNPRLAIDDAIAEVQGWVRRARHTLAADGVLRGMARDAARGARPETTVPPVAVMQDERSAQLGWLF